MTEPRENQQPPSRWQVRWKVLLGALAGLGALALFLVGGLTCAYELLGEERTFLPETFQVTGAWLTVHVAAELMGGGIAGTVAFLVGGKRAVFAVALLLFFLGAMTATQKMQEGNYGRPRGQEPTDGQSAQTDAISPGWKLVLSPLCLGGMALVAGGILGRRQPD
ncbi:MAG: hypothetical protein DWH82_05550 [Planctomycetota bacterium]|nr:MAG: hypothetical protein DWH82_05550 [Planctomycetota bacterium]